jgi:hypothetical protein
MVDENRPDAGTTPHDSSGRHLGRSLLLVCTLGIWGLVELLMGGARRTPHPEPLIPPPEPEVDGHGGDEEIRHPDGRIEHPSVRFEHRDADFRWILGILIGAMIFAAAVHWIILEFFFSYNRYESQIKASPYPLATTPSRRLPPEPRLEPLDRMGQYDSSNVYLRQLSREKILDSYGPREEKGFVHIPISEAMKKVIPTLQSRKAPPAEDRHDNGLIDWGESNSGRLFRRQPSWTER